MAQALGALVEVLVGGPAWLVGHSAGAAIGARLAIDRNEQVCGLVSLNGAWLPLRGWAWPLFSPLAQGLALNPWVPSVVSWQARHPALVQGLLAGTGSTLSDPGRALYQRLVQDPEHVRGALAMMARWDLSGLERDLGRLRAAVHLLTGERDQTIPPSHSDRVARLVPHAQRAGLGPWGHLAHEEDPIGAARAIDRAVRGALA